jgi:phosphate transport system permease protein
MISSLSEDAIYAVPDSIREAAYGLGASKMPAIFRVIVPSAWSGIAAAGQRTDIGTDPREQTETLASYIVRIAKGDLETGSTVYSSIFAVGLMLFAMTLAMNLISYRLSRKLRARNRT